MGHDGTKFVPFVPHTASRDPSLVGESALVPRTLRLGGPRFKCDSPAAVTGAGSFNSPLSLRGRGLWGTTQSHPKTPKPVPESRGIPKTRPVAKTGAGSKSRVVPKTGVVPETGGLGLVLGYPAGCLVVNLFTRDGLSTLLATLPSSARR